MAKGGRSRFYGPVVMLGSLGAEGKNASPLSRVRKSIEERVGTNRGARLPSLLEGVGAAASIAAIALGAAARRRSG